MRIRRALVAALAAQLLAAGACLAAERYPSRPVRLLVPFPPGGGADTLARIVTPRLSEAMGAQWVVDNRGGAAGNLAAEIVARAAPDGHTLLMGFSTVLTVNPSLYARLPFDVARDFAPITLLASAQYILVVHSSVPAASLKEFVALAKAKPRGLNYASAGVGSPLHLAAELFKSRAGVDLVHVPYKGGGPAAAAVLAGETQVLFGSVASSLPHVRTGRLKALAVTGPKRAAVAPDLPTLVEAGYPDLVVTSWYGLLAPAKTPATIVKQAHAQAVKAMALPEVVEAAGRQGLEPSVNEPRAFADLIRSETATWAQVVKTAGIKAD